MYIHIYTATLSATSGWVGAKSLVRCHVWVRVCVCGCVCLYSICIWSTVHLYIHTDTDTDTYANIHAFTHTHMHTHIGCIWCRDTAVLMVHRQEHLLMVLVSRNFQAQIKYVCIWCLDDARSI